MRALALRVLHSVNDMARYRQEDCLFHPSSGLLKAGSFELENTGGLCEDTDLVLGETVPSGGLGRERSMAGPCAAVAVTTSASGRGRSA